MSILPSSFLRTTFTRLATCAALMLAGAASAQTTAINYGDVWRYNIPLTDPGTTWRNVAFNDAGWASGAGLLGFETASLPSPGLQTAVGTAGTSQMVYLFRKTFNYNGGTSGVTLSIDQIVDDGVSYYLNGSFIGSTRHAAESWNNAADGGVGDAVEELRAVNASSAGLINGTNVLAVEVHQNTVGSSDLVFGARLKINPPPANSDEWRQQNFGTIANSGNAADLADPDHDGLVNLVEYALMQDPNRPSANWGTAALSGPTLTLTYLRRKAALAELTFNGFWAVDSISPWSSSGVTEQVLADDGVVQTVRALVSISGLNKRLFRIHITRPAPVTPTAPTAPSNAIATATSISQINVTWTDNSNNETGFKIERRQSGTASFSPLGTVAAGITSFQDSTASPSTRYYYQISATNAGGDSAFTPSAYATTLPLAPGNFAANAASDTQINLSWTDSTNNETGYRIERRQNGTATFTLLADTAADVTSFQDTGLPATTQYFYRIATKNVTGTSAFSAEVNATTQATNTQPPATLTLSWPLSRTVVQRNQNNQGTIRVAGSVSPAVQAVEARFTALQGGTSTGWLNVASNVTGAFSKNLTVSGGWYQLEVRAMNGGSQSGNILTVDKCGVGEVFVVAGQSNAQGGHWDNDNPEAAADDRVNCISNYHIPVAQHPDGSQYYPDDVAPAPVFAHLEAQMDPSPQGYTSAWLAPLGDRLTQRLNVPVLFFNCAFGGTSVQSWAQSADGIQGYNVYNESAPFPPGLPWNGLKVTIRDYVSKCGCRAVLWHQGETDGVRNQAFEYWGQGSPGVPATQYRDWLLHVVDRSRQDLGFNMPWVVARASLYSSSENKVSYNIVNGQNLAISSGTNMWSGPNTDGIQLPRHNQNVHIGNFPGGDPNSKGHRIHAQAWNDSLTDTFFNNSTPYQP